MKDRIIITIIYGLLMISVIGLLSGCTGSANDDDGNFEVYYVDKENTHISAIRYKLELTDADAAINSAIELLREQPKDYELRPALSEEVNINYINLNEGLLLIDFGTEYLKTSGREEILRRAAIVRTLYQIDDVEEISFTVDGAELNDSNGTPVGLMSADMFIDNAGNEINSYERTHLVLYYANEEGTGLVKTTEALAYNSNISMEKLVCEQIIAGPLVYGAYPVTDPGVKILAVSTKDGICYVNLNKDFLEIKGVVSDEVILYAFVNSLTELPNINKVQFMIDSETEISFGDHSYLNEPYERNLELVEEK